MKTLTLKYLRANYPHGANEWLDQLAREMIKYNYFEKQPLVRIREQIDEKEFLDSYYMNCYSARDAVIEDLSYA